MSSYVKLNYKIIFHLMGLLIGVNGGFMLLATFVSYYYSDGVAAEMLEASIITIFIGAIIMLLTKNKRKELQKRDGYVIVTFGWIFMSLAGTLALYYNGSYP